MNNTYKLVVRPRLHFVLPGRGPLLTEGMVLEALTGVVIHELSEDELGNRTLHVELPRESDAEALDALVLFVERLGFSVLEVTVNEWASQILERGLVGLLGGGTLGAASDNGAVAFIAAVGGALLGGLSGAEARKLNAEYESRRDAWGAWSFHQRQSLAGGIQPEISPG